MLNTYEAWLNNRPVRDRLPGINGGYTDNVLADWLTAYFDGLLVGLKADIDDLPRQLEPQNTDADWLDYLAQLCGATDEYWSRDWPENAKRNYLQESYRFLWPQKGTQGVLSFVLINLDILHVIRPKSSFIIGESEVGDELGLSGWQYEIVLPPQYFGTAIANTVAAIDELFGPCWCVSEIIYDDQYFAPEELLTIGGEELLGVESSTALRV